MKVMQIIDSLEAGGAERMAVNYANALQGKIDGSYLCCTRKEGLLKSKISNSVGYCFLNKSSTFDRQAFNKLKRFIVTEQIDIVHAHSSSYFLAVVIKLLALKHLKIVWHDHYGNSEFLERRPKAILRFFSGYFNGVISVNTKLGNWAKANLRCSTIKVFRNFLSGEISISETSVLLKGGSNDFKFICVANLRSQKDQLTLLKAFKKLKAKNVSLHLVGKDFEDAYSKEVKIQMENSTNVFFYGSQENIRGLLDQANAGVLSSVSEGLPLALLEYGLAGLPIVCTDVGECREVLAENGMLVTPGDALRLSEAMKAIMLDPKFETIARKFQEKVRLKYSEAANLSEILKFYQSIK